MDITSIKKIMSILLNSAQFSPVFQTDIDICIQSLFGLKKSYIPDSYVEFLKSVSNGLSFDGICLFGTIDQKHKTYFIQSILTINEQFSDIDFLENRLIIGQFFNLYIVYNYDTNNYELINLISFFALEIYNSFENLFYELLIKRSE